MKSRFAVLPCLVVLGVITVNYLTHGHGTEAVVTPRNEVARRPVLKDSPRLENITALGDDKQRASLMRSGGGEQPPVGDVRGEGSLLIVKIRSRDTHEPIASVRVVLLEDASNPSAPTDSLPAFLSCTRGDTTHAPITDSTGQVEFDLAAGCPYALRASGESRTSGCSQRIAVAPLREREHRVLTLELPTRSDLHYFGRILSAADWAPIPGAQIDVGLMNSPHVGDGMVTEVRRLDPAPTAHTVTDSEGVFELLIPSWVRHDARVSAPGFSEAFIDISSGHEMRVTAMDTCLCNAATLSAVLTDSGGRPALDAGVVLWTDVSSLARPHNGEVVVPVIFRCEWQHNTSDKGICVIRDIPSEVPMHVELYREGKLLRRDLPDMTLRPGENRAVDWKIDAGCVISGSVTDQMNKTVSGCTLWIERAGYDGPENFDAIHRNEVPVEATTTNEGRYEVRGISPGIWWIGPAPARNSVAPPDLEAISPVAQVVTVREGDVDVKADLQVTRGLFITGRILGFDGGATWKATVSASSNHIGWPMSGRVNEDGEFSVGPLIPGAYALVAEAECAGSAPSVPVAAEAGQSNVVLQLTEGGSISGTIADVLTGARCQAQIIYALRHAAAERQIGVDGSRNDGTFRCEGLRPGVYDISASCTDGRCGMLKGVVVRAGENTPEQVLGVSRGACVRIRNARGVGTLSFVAYEDGVPVAADGIEPGCNAEFVVPPARISVRTTWPPVPCESQDVQVGVGETKDIVFGKL